MVSEWRWRRLSQCDIEVPEWLPTHLSLDGCTRRNCNRLKSIFCECEEPMSGGKKRCQESFIHKGVG